MLSMREAKLRHARYYDEMATQQSQKQADYTWIDNNLGQLEQVQTHLGTLSDPTSAKLLVKLTETIAFAWFNYGQRGQMLEWCDRALHIADQIHHNPGSLLIAKGRLEAALGNGNEAIQSYQRAVAVSDPSTLIHAQAQLALAGGKLSRGEYQGMLNEFDNLATLLRKHKNDDYIVLVEYQIAIYHFRIGQLEQALQTFLDLENKLRERPELAGLYPGTEVTELQYTVWFAIGGIYRKLAASSIRHRQNYYQQAIDYLSLLYAESKARYHREMEAASAHHLGWSYLNRGELEQALTFAHRSQEAYEKLNRIAGMADVYEQIGLIYVALGQPEVGLPSIQRSFELRNQIENKHGAASSMRRIAIAQFHLGQLRKSIASLASSMQMYHSMGVLGIKRLIGITLELLEWTIGRKRFTL